MLRELGFKQFRVRHYDALARIEIAKNELPRAMETEMSAKIDARLKQVGYTFVTLDPEGYRQGSLNVIHGSAIESPCVEIQTGSNKIHILR